MKITWPAFKFPPINLWNFTKQYRDFKTIKPAQKNQDPKP